jgi:hypothetical protein
LVRVTVMFRVAGGRGTVRRAWRDPRDVRDGRAPQADKSSFITCLFEASQLSWTFTPPVRGGKCPRSRLAGTPCPQLPGFIASRAPWVPRSFPRGLRVAPDAGVARLRSNSTAGPRDVVGRQTRGGRNGGGRYPGEGHDVVMEAALAGVARRRPPRGRRCGPRRVQIVAARRQL